MNDTEIRIAAIDQGSTTTKGAVFTSTGATLREETIAVETEVSGESIRHDPETLAEAVAVLAEQLLDAREVSAIGLTCQRSTCLVWERESGRPLTPALSWQDTSQGQRLEELREHAAEIAGRTGLRLSPHYAAPKLSYLLDQIPQGYERARSGELVAGTLDAFLIRQLTGRDLTEPGQAGRTLLYNLELGRWDPFLCDLFGIPPAALPEVVTSAGDRGSFRGAAVTAVTGDQQAALLGHGGWQPGVTAAHFGTGAFVLSSTGSVPLRHPRLLTAALATTPTTARFQTEGSINSAGSAVDWACRLTGEKLESWTDRELDPASLPAVLPSFAGAAAPWWQADARAVISGLTLEASGEELFGGVLAGVAMRVIDCVEILREAGAAAEVLRVSGKLTRLRGLVGLLADAGQLPIEVAATEEMGLRGVSRLALAALEGDEEGLESPPPAARRREPRWPPERAHSLRQAWREFATAALDTRDLRIS
jgi:glycerol kinase